MTQNPTKAEKPKDWPHGFCVKKSAGMER